MNRFAVGHVLLNVGASDLHVSSVVLDEVRAALASVTATLDAARRAIGSVDPSVAGPAPLANQAEAYAASWVYGITQLGQHAQQCIDELNKIAAAFDETDRRLASVIAQSGAHPGVRHGQSGVG